MAVHLTGIVQVYSFQAITKEKDKKQIIKSILHTRSEFNAASVVNDLIFPIIGFPDPFNVNAFSPSLDHHLDIAY